MEIKNKPDQATMRPDCVSMCIDHVTYMERQMDEQTGGKGSQNMLVDHLFQYRISPWPKTAEKRGFCTCVTDLPIDGPTGGWTDGRTDRQMDGRTDGRMDGWMDGWTDGWTDRRTKTPSYRVISHD